MSRFANKILSMGHGLTQLFTDSFELLVAGGSILDVGCRYKLKVEDPPFSGSLKESKTHIAKLRRWEGENG